MEGPSAASMSEAALTPAVRVPQPDKHADIPAPTSAVPADSSVLEKSSSLPRGDKDALCNKSATFLVTVTLRRGTMG